MKGLLAGILMGLMVVPAEAFYVGFTYVDGSDSVFKMDPTTRDVFEATISGELEKWGSKESEIADFKGLVVPIFPVGGAEREGYICGWVKGFAEVTGREFMPFYYFRSGPHAGIVTEDDGHDQRMFERTGCREALGL